MAPRSSSATVSASPYSRRSASHPKSSRQQFTACGACRMRRVRCDLKDLPIDTSGPSTSCSNCKERGLKCVDEFAEVKTVKLLRRGRRLQQVEAIYGKANGSDLVPPSCTLRPASIIPQLQPEFFSSSFWNRFGVQRPIIDPAEFAARFNAHYNGSHPLSPGGKLIAMLLAVWAFSLGVDERGVESSDGDQDGNSNCMQRLQDDNVHSHDERCRRRKGHTNAMVREVLQLVDSSSIMRKPSWDGVRVLLLLWPLMEDSQLPFEVLATYEAAMGQIRGLASLSSFTPPFSRDSASPSIHAYTNNALSKARIFWYAYAHEGITTGLRGGRLMLDEMDLETFQKALPNLDNVAVDPQPSSIPSALLPASALFPLPTQQQTLVLCQPQDPLPYAQPFSGQQHPGQFSSSQQSYLNATQLFTIPLRLSNICRKVHAFLTGRDARRRMEQGFPINADGLQEVWDGLDACWRELDALRHRCAVAVVAEDLEQYASTWQIFIFECHNVIRDILNQDIISQSPPGVSPYHTSTAHLTPPPSSAPSVFRLHTLAVRRCMKLLPLVLQIIKVHLQISGKPLFKWDTGLIGDGCFFAGFLAAGGENDHASSAEDASARLTLKQEDAETSLVQNEGVNLCLRALQEMRWSFAKAEERAQTIQMISNARRPETPSPSAFPQHESLQLVDGFTPFDSHAFMQPLQDTPFPLPPHRPYVPPLDLTLSHPETLLTTPASSSTPPTASTDAGGSWRAYTPPGTATSGSGSALNGSGDSPVYSVLSDGHLQVYTKGGGDMTPSGDMLYQAPAGIVVDMNPFSFSVPVSGYPHQCGHRGQDDTCGWQLPERCRCF